MTSLPTAYTPLETLLLFQALRAEGVSSLSVFNRISEQLKAIPLVRDDPTYDSGRLSPDALRELYLRLLKDEVRRDQARSDEKDNPNVNGDSSPGSRKRKAPSPTLPSVQEAAQHKHLIPQLVARLYARYRENAVREIREQERRYDALVQEVRDLEGGKADERLQRPSTASASQSPRLPATTTQVSTLQQDIAHRLRSTNGAPLVGQAPMDQNANAAGTAGANNHVPGSPSAAIHPLANGAVPSIQPDGTAQPRLYNQHGQPIVHGLGTAVQNDLAATQAQPARTQLSQSPYPNVPRTGSPQWNGTGPGQQNIAHRPPPPAGRGFVPHHTAQSPLQQQMGAQYSPHQPLPSYPNQQPPGSGHQLPPFQIDPQQTGRPPHGQFAAAPPHLAPMPYDSSSTQGQPHLRPHPPSAPATIQRPNASRTSSMSHILRALETPPRLQRTPTWKSDRPSSHIRISTPLGQPMVEPLSPTQTRAELPARTTRSTRNRDAEAEEQPQELESLQKTTRRRGRSKRERSPHSVVSSAAEESTRMTRSQSISTTTGTMLTGDDRPESRGFVKMEPSTPAAFTDDHESVRDQSATPGGATRMTRKRRGTLQSQGLPPTKRAKRRQASTGPEEAASDVEGSPPPRSTTITAYRNFHKLSATIMNDINSHKHASYFANMVRDRDAPGYSEIIKQPQHLKSIRAAITAGSRAVTAASLAIESPSGVDGGSSSTTVELERSEEYMPPKAIVNGAQLEKEVMRMLANAVMFNPGHDGMVQDTREMFEDVEAQIRHWRGAEKEVGEASTAAAADEVVEEGKGKRRKG